MTDREKNAHLLRRFGLGAGRYALRPFESSKPEQTLDRLIDFESQDEGFDVSPSSFAIQPDGQYYTDAYQAGTWWSLRLLMTRRPFQEKLTLFWHDHFAVSGEKVFEGANMAAYLDILRQKGAGKFRDLLAAVSRHAALIAYLDNNTSTRIHPNENFAREMFELFTMGVGNYTETDVKEAARAFTGWSVHYLGLGDETPFERQAEKAAREGMAIFNFCDVPALRDTGDKTILGVKRPWTADEVLDMLADRPETAKHVCGKLWRFFAGTEPTPEVLARLTSAWKRSDGDIKSVVRAIASSPAFWSSDVVRSQPKSPVDYTVSLFRALDLDSALRTFVAGTKPDKAVREEARKAGQAVYFLMAQQGMTLLFPPNVGGWEWGQSWITANNTVTRVNHSGLLFTGDDPNRPIAQLLANKLKSEERVASAADIVDVVADVFDAMMSAKDRDVLIEACSAAGGVAALNEKDSAAGLLTHLTKVLFAAPSFQLC